jgi:hypothetical protein
MLGLQVEEIAGMFGFTEFQGQSSLLHTSGTVELNTEYCTQKKPAWLVLIKLLCVAGMVAIGYGITVPTFLELKYPLWQAFVLGTAAMMLYTGVAFFIRPEANTDNLGWGGGMGNDPFQYSDNVNRFLWRAHCFLGPGRFTSETLLDLCVLLGLAGGDEVQTEEIEPEDQIALECAELIATSFDATKPIAPLAEGTPFASSAALSPDRFEPRSPNPFAGQQTLESWKYFQQSKS